MKAQGVIAREAGKQGQVEDFQVDDPGPGEVRVRIQASGVCHTDLLYQNGDAGDNFPFLLGHEGAGVVEAVGPRVQTLREGDYVILAWRGPCGRCRFCRVGLLHLCPDNLTAPGRMRTEDGKTLTAVGGVGTFCTHTVVNAAQAIPVPEQIPPEQASLIGCGVMTGVGAVLNTAEVRRGSSVAVFGCGGVGASVVQGARIAGASRIIAVDIAPDKLELAKELGATDTVDASSSEPVDRVLELTGGFGVNYSFES